MTNEMTLFDAQGRRKYLTPDERMRFRDAAAKLDDRFARTFCLVLADTGCRISEALALTYPQVDLDAGQIVIRSLKKRNTQHHRAVAVTPSTLDALELVHGVRRFQRLYPAKNAPLWAFGRSTGWAHVKRTMALAGVIGPQAMPKGLRHGFAVAALSRDVPLTLIRRWLGHASLETTALYLEVCGAEERQFAERLWSET